jgi:hypothetical protein
LHTGNKRFQRTAALRGRRIGSWTSYACEAKYPSVGSSALRNTARSRARLVRRCGFF